MKKLLMILPLALILCFMVGCKDKEAMAELEEFKAQAALEEQNIAMMRKSYEEWNKGNPGFFMESTTPDYVYYSPSGNPNPNTREDAVESVKLIWKGFPDASFSIVDIMADGDKTVTRFVIRGTHEGEFMGIPATGKKSETSAIHIFRLRNGKIVEQLEELDMLGVYQQLGMELKPKEKE